MGPASQVLELDALLRLFSIDSKMKIDGEPVSTLARNLRETLASAHAKALQSAARQPDKF